MLTAIVMGLGPPWFAALLAIWAPLVSIARVALGVHYVSDIVVGAVLGVFLGWVNYLLIPSLIPSLNNLI
jgi:undecaprenyl-diphosphatase